MRSKGVGETLRCNSHQNRVKKPLLSRVGIRLQICTRSLNVPTSTHTLWQTCQCYCHQTWESVALLPFNQHLLDSEIISCSLRSVFFLLFLFSVELLSLINKPLLFPIPEQRLNIKSSFHAICSVEVVLIRDSATCAIRKCRFICNSNTFSINIQSVVNFSVPDVHREQSKFTSKNRSEQEDALQRSFHSSNPFLLFSLSLPASRQK